MKTRLLFAAIAIIAAHSVAIAQSKLSVKSITGSPGGFSVDSTLVSGDKDAILIDAQFTQADAHRVVAEIIESKKNLTTVYVTHSHPDHYFGVGVIKQAFPNARIVALPAAIKDIRATAEPKVKQWQPLYGNNVTSAPVVPEPLAGKTLTLEGETLEIIGGLQGDAANNSYVWIPSLKAAIVGDIAFSGIYPWTADTSPAERKEWIKTIDAIAARKPAIVVAGHKRPELANDAASLAFTKTYLADFDRARASSKNSEELQKNVKAKYPTLGLDIILKIGADAAFADHKH